MTEQPKAREGRTLIRLLDRLKGLSHPEVLLLIRAFSIFSPLANREMALAKSCMAIARRYSELVDLLVQSSHLAKSIRSRLPDVDALNHLQVDQLRWRRAGDAGTDIHTAIHMSINGVAAGLRNCG
jgi:phosphoenolpyruvate carboxylase